MPACSSRPTAPSRGGSASASALFGGSLPGRALAELLPSPDLPGPAAGLGRAAATGVDGGGAAFPVEVGTTPAPGSGLRHVVFVRDLRAGGLSCAAGPSPAARPRPGPA